MKIIDKDTPFEARLVSIVIVNYNGEKYLEPLFNSLLGMDRDNIHLEMIMVDNLSNDDSVSLVKKMYPEIVILENDVNNFTRALNLAVEHAKGDYIAFLNNDTIVDRHWLTGLLDVIDEDEGIGAVQSKILFSDKETINSVGLEEEHFYFKDIGFNERDRGQYEITREMNYYTGGSVLLRRACINSIGPIDEDFIMFYEDVDYSIRCKKAGWKIFYSPKSTVYHKYHGVASMELASYLSSRNRLLCIAKHFPLKFSEGVKTSKFHSNCQHESLYQSLIQAARKLIAGHSVEISLKVFAELKDILIDIYGAERTAYFFSQVDILTGLKQIKMGIYDHPRKYRDGETMDTGQFTDLKPSFYPDKITGPLYMAATLDRPVIIVFNQAGEVMSLLQKSEHDRKACLLQIDELNRMILEKDKQMQLLTEWATGAETYARSLEEASMAERAEAVRQVQSLTEWATGAETYARSLEEASMAERAEAVRQVQSLTEWATSAETYARSLEEELTRIRVAGRAHEVEIEKLKK